MSDANSRLLVALLSPKAADEFLNQYWPKWLSQPIYLFLFVCDPVSITASRLPVFCSDLLRTKTNR